MYSRKNLIQQLPIMLLAVLSLLAALWGGLSRIGWSLPSGQLRLPAAHGPLMIAGFLGCLITLERAVALRPQVRRGWLLFIPAAAAGAGALLIVTPLPVELGITLNLLGAAGLVGLFAIILRRQPTFDHGVMAGGAVLWLIGDVLWLTGSPLFRVVPWWSGFLILTIAGERLELSRVLRHGRYAQRLFLTAAGFFLLGLFISLISLDSGLRIAGLGLLFIGVWLLRYDIAIKTMRKTGLTRYIALCLLPGYLWLAAAGLMWLFYGGRYVAGPIYDGMMHIIFLGFVMSMIFGHAPIILPALLPVQITFFPLLYLPLILLHLSLIMRLIGNYGFWLDGRPWGGLLNEIAIILFLGLMALTTRGRASLKEN